MPIMRTIMDLAADALDPDLNLGQASPVVFALFLVAISRYRVDRPDLAGPILEGKG